MDEFAVLQKLPKVGGLVEIGAHDRLVFAVGFHKKGTHAMVAIAQAEVGIGHQRRLRHVALVGDGQRDLEVVAGGTLKKLLGGNVRDVGTTAGQIDRGRDGGRHEAVAEVGAL